MKTSDRGFLRELLAEGAVQALAAVAVCALLGLSMLIERMAWSQAWPIAGWVFPVMVAVVSLAFLGWITRHVVRHMRRHGQTWSLIDISGVSVVGILLLVCVAGFACMGYDRLVVPHRPAGDVMVGQVVVTDVPMRTVGRIRAGTASLAGPLVDTALPHQVWIAEAPYDVHIDAGGVRRTDRIIDEPMGSASGPDIRRPVAVIARFGVQTVLLTWPTGPTAPSVRTGDRVEIGHRRGLLLDLWHVERIVGADGTVRWSRPSRG